MRFIPPKPEDIQLYGRSPVKSIPAQRINPQCTLFSECGLYDIIILDQTVADLHTGFYSRGFSRETGIRQI